MHGRRSDPLLLIGKISFGEEHSMREKSKHIRQNTRKRTRRLAICAILSAIGVILLYLGALIEVLDLSVVVIASLVCILAVLEMGGAWPWMIYGVVSILSLVLLPQKNPAILFLLFGGYYPILKAYYERLIPPVSWLLKFVNFSLALGGVLFLSKKVLLLPDLALLDHPLGIAVTLVVGDAVFLLYDIALTRLITVYLRIYREKLRIRNW